MMPYIEHSQSNHKQPRNFPKVNIFVGIYFNTQPGPVAKQYNCINLQYPLDLYRPTLTELQKVRHWFWLSLKIYRFPILYTLNTSFLHVKGMKKLNNQYVTFSNLSLSLVHNSLDFAYNLVYFCDFPVRKKHIIIMLVEAMNVI